MRTQPIKSKTKYTPHHFLTERRLKLLTRTSLLAGASCFAFFAFVVTYVLFVCVSDSGDFAFMIAFGPAGLAGFAMWNFTAAIGHTFIQRWAEKLTIPLWVEHCGVFETTINLTAQ